MAKKPGLRTYSAQKNDNNYLYTKGGEYSLNGLNYIGEYHLDGTIPKTGPIIAEDTMELRKPYTNINSYNYDVLRKFKKLVTRFQDPKPYLYTPNSQVYTVGFDTRYFVEKIEDNESYAIEIDQNQYGLIGQPNGIDIGLYPIAIVNWKLTGTSANIIAHNELEIYKASFTCPSVAYAVRNYLEYAQIALVWLLDLVLYVVSHDSGYQTTTHTVTQ